MKMLSRSWFKLSRLLILIVAIVISFVFINFFMSSMVLNTLNETTNNIVDVDATSHETNIQLLNTSHEEVIKSPSNTSTQSYNLVKSVVHTKKALSQPVFNSSTKKSGLSDKNISQQCKLRDLSHYSTEKVGDLHEISLSNNLKTSNCLFYVCNRDAAECDNKLPTNFDGPKPPCCTHILRDMSRNFDEAMCNLGLDYVVTYGTLLGFRRGDHIIPWTADLDYIIPSKDVANEMVALWDTNNTGMAHIFQGINRMCVTSDFAGGALQRKWRRLAPKNKLNLDSSGLPYIDFYVGSRVGSTMFQPIKGCTHFFGDVFPTKRELVYNYTFSQNFPANSDQLLRTSYGKDWRTPQKDKNPYGDSRCYGGPFL